MKISPTCLALILLFIAPAAGAAQPRKPLEGPRVLEHGGQQIRVVPILGLERPWALAILPSGDILVTERPGRLRIIRDGLLDPKPISGLPDINVGAVNSGLMDIALHPDHRSNRMVYFTYSKPMVDNPHPDFQGERDAATVTLARARFDGGSALTAGGNAAMAIAVTHISAAAGAFTWMSVEWIKYGKPSALGAVTGMVAGLGTITPASGYVGPAGALVIGIAAGLVCFYATNIMKQKLKIDDTLDVFPVHGVGGFLGIMLTAIFASNTLGIFAGQETVSMGSQLLTQFTGAIAVIAYTAAATWAILLLVGRLVGTNRVTGDNEVLGLDLSEHNERGYVL